MSQSYQPWLFDDRGAWERAVSDPRWNYDLPITHFMAIYNEYRGQESGNLSPKPQMNSQSFSAAAFKPQTATAPPPVASGGAGQILSQNEIDSLLNQMTR